MNIVFITLAGIADVDQRGIYPDLIRHFIDSGHHVSVVSPIERKEGQASFSTSRNGHNIIRVRTLNIQKTNFFEKAIGTFLIDYQFKKALQKHLTYDKVDLILYSTPPITIVNSIAYLKSKFKARTYLLLKDIFPQNAVDLSLLKKGGLMYNFFRRKEKELYNLSDTIGCMSMANVGFILKNNAYLDPTKVEVCPNSIRPEKDFPSAALKKEKRTAYNIPLSKKVFIYGGNLGKPQDIDFVIEFLTHQMHNEKAYFIIMGSGTEYYKLENWYEKYKPENVKLTAQLSKKVYDDFQKCGDVGLIFLDKRFTIPNYPSRLLPYMDDGMPVIAATDAQTDIGAVIVNNNFGKACLSGDLETLNSHVDYFCHLDDNSFEMLRNNSKSYLINNDTVTHSYAIIMDAMSRI